MTTLPDSSTTHPIDDQMLWIAERTSPCANASPPRISTRAASASPRPTSRRPITGSAAKPATTRNRTVSQPLASSPTLRLVSLAACAMSGAASSAVAATVTRSAATSVHTIACLRDGPVTGHLHGCGCERRDVDGLGWPPAHRHWSGSGPTAGASWPASGGDRIGLDGSHVPAVAVHDGELVAERPLGARLIGGG